MNRCFQYGFALPCLLFVSDSAVAVTPRVGACSLAVPDGGEMVFVANGGTARHLKFMRQEAILSDGVLPARLKTLAAALWSVSARCEPYIRFYMQKAHELGATREEIGEILAIASTMGGCVGETRAAKAFSVVTDRQKNNEACCQT